MFLVQTLIFFVSLVILGIFASHEPLPASLNVVLVGFHNPERGFISEYDLERALTETAVVSTLSLGEAPYNHIRSRIRQLGPRIPAQAFACELKSLADALNLGDKGFTLFVLNIDTGMNNSHAYCEGFGKYTCLDNELDLDPSNLDGSDRGEKWARSRMTQKGSSSKTSNQEDKCNENDTCLVNAWISNDRIAWVDLSAQRIRWGTQFGLSLPSPPTHKMTLEEQRQRAKNIKLTAAKDKNCKDCASFLQAWSSLLDQAAKDSDFFGAYDTVARAADELEAIISREFAITGKSDRMMNSPENNSLSPALSSSAEFAAHLSLVVQSFASRVLLPFNPEFVLGSPLESSQDARKYEADPLDGPASRVSVHLYLVRGHNDDKDLGPNESDIDRMRTELAKLASPSIQTFSLVVHKLDMDLDPVLSSAFAFALHTMIIPVSMNGRVVEEKRHYLDAKEFRQVLLAENDRAHLAFSASSGKARNSNHMEIPVFWFFGVDSSSEPLYIDGHHRAVYLDDIGIVVESKHAAVERVDAWCGDARVKVSVARPIRAATLAIARLWWRGNLDQSYGLKLNNENKARGDDWTWSVGVGDAKGMSIFEERGEEETAKELISNVMIDAFHRSTVLETFRRITKMVDRVVKRSRPESEVKAIHEDKQAIAACARKSDWSCAFLKLDVCIKRATKVYKDAKSKNALVKDSRLPSSTTTSCIPQEANEDNSLQGLFQSALTFLKRLVPSLQS